MTDDQSNAQTTPAERPRDSGGRYATDPQTAERDVEAMQLRKQGLSYRQIAERMGESNSTSYERVARAMAEIRREPAEDLVKMHLEKLGDLERQLRAVMEGHHMLVSHGRVIQRLNEDGTPGPAASDPGPPMQAAMNLLKVLESERKLLGLDQPAKQEISGEVTYKIIGVDEEDM